MEWQLQEAKNKFSEVVRRAKEEGPQVITVRGERKAVVVSAEEYDALKADKNAKPEKKKPKMDFVEMLLSGPPWPDDILDAINDRDKTPMRDIKF